jgi:hypothetical protein
MVPAAETPFCAAQYPVSKLSILLPKKVAVLANLPPLLATHSKSAEGRPMACIPLLLMKMQLGVSARKNFVENHRGVTNMAKGRQHYSKNSLAVERQDVFHPCAVSLQANFIQNPLVWLHPSP